MITHKHLKELGFTRTSRGVWYNPNMDMLSDARTGYWKLLSEMQRKIKPIMKVLPKTRVKLVKLWAHARKQGKRRAAFGFKRTSK